jgi:SAM-dependent methyltransferase
VKGIIRILRKGGVRPGSRILDVSCGIGRHSVRLAERGYRVTGIDPSLTFLDRARELASRAGVSENATFVRGRFSDLTDVLSRRRGDFDGAILMDNSIGVTGRDKDDLQLFEDLAAFVVGGGILIVEIGDRVNVGKHYQWTMIQEFPDNLVRIWKCLSPPGSLVHEAEWRFYRKQPDQSLEHLLTTKVKVRHYSTAELRRLVGKAGWRYLSCYGSLVELRPFTDRDYSAYLVFANGQHQK